VLASLTKAFNRSRERYRGAYEYNEETGRLSGNPARAASVEDIMTTIKNKCGAKGGQRNHAEAIRIEEMKQVMDWSEAQCPEVTVGSEMRDVARLLHTAKHVMMRAFMSTGFTIWTRYLLIRAT
jgi:hypothetical protein